MMKLQRSFDLKRKVRRKAKYAVNSIGYQLGFRSGLLKMRGKRILVYHGVCKKDHLRYNASFVTIKMFEKHLTIFRKYCNIISLDDFYNDRVVDDKLNICLSFDDGLANNYEYVLPILEKHRVPATFFITAIRDAGYDILWNHFLDIAGESGPPALLLDQATYKKRNKKYWNIITGEKLNDTLRKEGFSKKAALYELLNSRVVRNYSKEYWLQMNEEQIRKLADSKYVTIGCHGYYHNDLSCLAVDEVKNELMKNKSFLENIISKEITSLAFPYGSYNSDVIAIAKQAGFKKLLALEYADANDATDPMLEQRITVNPYLSAVNLVQGVAKGNYD